MRLGLGIFCIVLSALSLGCSITTPTPPSTAVPFLRRTRPDDFALEYRWREASLPPPYHYEYTITIKPTGHGEIVMIPDYPNVMVPHYPVQTIPRWTETFALQSKQLDQLYGLLIETGLFAPGWETSNSESVGGTTQSLSVTAFGKRVVAPAHLKATEADSMQAIYSAIQAAVPKSLWDSLQARRQEYVQFILAHTRK